MDFLKLLLVLLVLLGIGTAIGLTVEWYRRRDLRAFAKQQGGTFEAGSLLSGVPVPEAAAFDAVARELDEKITYRNVTRIPGEPASFVVAQYHESSRGTKDEVQSDSYVVCLVSLPGAPLPQVHVYPPHRPPGWIEKAMGMPSPQRPVPIPEPIRGFAEAFEAVPAPGAGEIDPAALARLLPREVQQELLARSSLVVGLQVRGDVVRIQAASKATGFPHREVFETARRLAASWAAWRSW
jgi:hypothetical protein